LNDGELCDTRGNSETCNSNCRPAACGDSFLNTAHTVLETGLHEQCDTGGDSRFCDGDCSPAICGDGYTNALANEGCDDGNEDEEDDCLNDCTPNVCGDGVRNLRGTALEACDDGNTETETECPYGQASCPPLCTAACQTPLTGRTGRYCGDGTKDGDESCDDGNALACGTCSADCQAATLSRAHGRMTAVAASHLKGETFTLLDGRHTPVVFEFDKDGNVSPGHVRIDVSGGNVDANAVATRIRSAINAIGAELEITASGTNQSVELDNDHEGSDGNQPVYETVQNSGFTVDSMAGGGGWDCLLGTGCTRNEDCAPGLSCHGGTCQPAIVTLIVGRTGSGSGTVTSNDGAIDCGATCSADYTAGTLVTLTASPSASSDFDGWSGGGCSGTDPCVISVDAATTVFATFTALHRLDVVPDGTGAGTVTAHPGALSCGTDCSEEYLHGTEVTLSASPSAGSTFAGWSGGGCSGTEECKVTMSAPTTITATFDLITRVLTVTRTGTGTGTVSAVPGPIDCGTTCESAYPSGSSVTLTATPGSGSTFVGWSGGGCSGSEGCLVPLDADTTVEARFDPSR